MKAEWGILAAFAVVCFVLAATFNALLSQPPSYTVTITCNVPCTVVTEP